MKNKLLISIILMFCIVMSVGCSESSDYELVFTEYENGVELYKFVPHKDEFDTVTIPDEYEGKSVIKIGDNAFDCSCSIQNIELPSKLEIIGDNSFSAKSKISLTKIPETISYVGEIRFLENDMNRFDIIKNSSSYKVIDDAVLSSDGSCLISYNSNLTNTEYIVPNGVTTICKNAFFNCKQLKKVTLPNTIETIEENAFEGCSNLVEINFPDKLKFIDISSLNSTKWYKDQSGEVIINGRFYLKTESEDEIFSIPDGITHFLCDFGDFDQSPSIIKIPDSLEYISPNITLANVAIFDISPGNKHFAASGDLLLSKDKTKLIRCMATTDESIDIPNSVTEICPNAFNYCRSKNIVIPDSVTIIDEGAFSLADIEKINIPNSITRLEKSTFYGCYMLEEIYIPDSVEYIHLLLKDDMVSFDEIKVKVKKDSFAQEYCELFDIDYDLT